MNRGVFTVDTSSLPAPHPQIALLRHHAFVLDSCPGAQVFEDPPCSCENGICTTCAGLIQEGTKGVNYKVAVDALGEDQRAKVYLRVKSDPTHTRAGQHVCLRAIRFSFPLILQSIAYFCRTNGGGF